MRSDPNHMGWVQKKVIQGRDPTQMLSFTFYRIVLETAWWNLCEVEQKTLSALTDWRNSLTSWRENWLGFGAPLRKHCWAKQSASVRGFSAFGPLGRGLLRFLSSSCSHSRRAGFSLAAPFCRHRHRGLAPRPTAGGKQGPSVRLWVLCLGAVNNLSTAILREN